MTLEWRNPNEHQEHTWFNCRACNAVQCQLPRFVMSLNKIVADCNATVDKVLGKYSL